MLHNISWSQYIITIGILMLLYYIAIILLYYRDEAIGFIRKGPTSISPGSNTNTEKATDREEIMDGLDSTVADLAGILEKAGTTLSRQELLRRLHHRLSSYAGLRHPAFRIAINNYIITHAKNLCKQTFSSEELNTTWDNGPAKESL